MKKSTIIKSKLVSVFTWGLLILYPSFVLTMIIILIY